MAPYEHSKLQQILQQSLERADQVPLPGQWSTKNQIVANAICSWEKKDNLILKKITCMPDQVLSVI